jgi:hypothetical protein
MPVPTPSHPFGVADHQKYDMMIVADFAEERAVEENAGRIIHPAFCLVSLF